MIMDENDIDRTVSETFYKDAGIMYTGDWYLILRQLEDVQDLVKMMAGYTDIQERIAKLYPPICFDIKGTVHDARILFGEDGDFCFYICAHLPLDINNPIAICYQSIADIAFQAGDVWLPAPKLITLREYEQRLKDLGKGKMGSK